MFCFGVDANSSLVIDLISFITISTSSQTNNPLWAMKFKIVKNQAIGNNYTKGFQNRVVPQI